MTPSPLEFPDPRSTTEDGILALGGNLLPATLLSAYRQGIFPWPISGLPLAWFCPPERAILEWNSLHIPRSLAHFRKKEPFRFTVDRAFVQVIQECARSPRPGQDGTWITQAMINAYCHLHQLGHAHSFEVWEQETLVGGVYGVDSGGSFSGESMFYKRPNASKLAILTLMEHLHERGLDWLDIQVMTPHLKALGARSVPRDEFLELLALTRSKKAQLFR